MQSLKSLFKTLDRLRARRAELETEREAQFGAGVVGYLKRKNERELAEINQRIANVENEIDSSPQALDSHARARASNAAPVIASTVVRLTPADVQRSTPSDVQRSTPSDVQRSTPSGDKRSGFVRIPGHLTNSLIKARDAWRDQGSPLFGRAYSDLIRITKSI